VLQREHRRGPNGLLVPRAVYHEEKGGVSKYQETGQ
jgi:hypothetical protein